LSCPCGSEGKEAAENRPKRLFSKNTGACEVDETPYRH
jgi:hypothetical protein